MGFKPPLRIHRKPRGVDTENMRPATWNCTDCKEPMPFTSDYFPIDSDGKWGLSYVCLTCQRKRNDVYKARKKAAAEPITVAASVDTQPDRTTEELYPVEVLFDCRMCGRTVNGQIHYTSDVAFGHMVGFSVKAGIGPVCPDCDKKLRAFKAAIK